ncbi:PadR family transcriptional regulator [Nonomuraea sp. NPDC003214]
MQPLPMMTPATVDVLEALMADLTERWGLEIIKEAGQRPGTGYVILDRLERSGWVTSAWESEPRGGGPRRRLYRLEGHALPAARRLVAARHPAGDTLPQPGF